MGLFIAGVGEMLHIAVIRSLPDNPLQAWRAGSAPATSGRQAKMAGCHVSREDSQR